jgi:hypothetical protein
MPACRSGSSEKRNSSGVQTILPARHACLPWATATVSMLAPSPSCSQVVFEMEELDSGGRAALVREEARRNGWTVTHSDDAQGGWSVFLKKHEFTAVVFLWRPEVYDVDCKGKPDPNSEAGSFCFNTLNVSR